MAPELRGRVEYGILCGVTLTITIFYGSIG
jgi:hypothetical protein